MLGAKMNSVVGILNYLATRGHKVDIRSAIHSQFQESLSPLDAEADDPAILQYATLPYLLHLASLSQTLLKIVSLDLVTSFSKPSVLRQLTEHLEAWLRETRSSNVGFDNQLLSLSIQLIARLEDGRAMDVFKLLLQTSDPDSFAKEDDDEEPPFIPEVARDASFALLDRVILFLQQKVYSSFKDKADVPFLLATKEHWNGLCRMALKEENLSPRLETILVRLLTYLALQSESLTSSILSTAILEAPSLSKCSVFFAILGGVHSVTPQVMANVVEGVFVAILSRDSEVDAHCALTNFCRLLEIEKAELTPSSTSSAVVGDLGLMPTVSLKTSLQSPAALTTLAKILFSFSTCRVLTRGIQLLSRIDLGSSSMSSSTLLATSVAVNFFKLTAITSKCCTVDVEVRLQNEQALKHCASFLARLSRKSSSIRTVVFRVLLEGCLSQEYSYLFSRKVEGQAEMSISDSSQIGGHVLSSELVTPGPSLRADNYALPSQRSGRSPPAGIIGKGLRYKVKTEADKESDEKQISELARKANKSLLLDVLYRCCCNQEFEDLSRTNSMSPPKKLPKLSPSRSATQSLSQLVAELVSPGALHSGLAWPDEDSIRQTVERDLCIKKRLQSNEFIVDILDLVAKGGVTSLIPSMVILRAWMASLVLFWDSNRESNPEASANTWYYSASLRLIKIMAVGQLLPHPLAHSDELFKYAAPFERYLLLVNIWRFMKEVPLPRDLDEDVLESRLLGVDPKFIEVMRSVINSNIARASHLFGFLFPITAKKRNPVNL